MGRSTRFLPIVQLLAVVAVVSGISGCLSFSRHPDGIAGDIFEPREGQRVRLSPHIISPPDILLIDALTLVPQPPYLIKPFDSLFVQVLVKGAVPVDPAKEGRGALIPGQPIDGVFRVEPDGQVNLGYDYGSVRVVGQAIPDAKKAITKHLMQRFKDFDVVVTLAESRGSQQIRGEHLVQPDGRVVLGVYGSVYVIGMTLEQAKAAIEAHLSTFFVTPEISLDIGGFNSRVYYIIFNQDSGGEAVIRLPMTGSETVLDALGEVKGLPPGANRKQIWIARPESGGKCAKVLAVDWRSITRKANCDTNYQILPGDRVFVNIDPWVEADNTLAKVFAPFERIFGITLLGRTTVSGFTNSNNTNGSNQ